MTINNLVLQGERETELVSVFVKTSSINGSTEVDLDTRTESLSVTIKNLPMRHTVKNTLQKNHMSTYARPRTPALEILALTKAVASNLSLAPTSRATALEPLESQEALPEASRSLLTRW